MQHIEYFSSPYFSDRYNSVLELYCMNFVLAPRPQLFFYPKLENVLWALCTSNMSVYIIYIYCKKGIVISTIHLLQVSEFHILHEWIVNSVNRLVSNTLQQLPFHQNLIFIHFHHKWVVQECQNNFTHLHHKSQTSYLLVMRMGKHQAWMNSWLL